MRHFYNMSRAAAASTLLAALTGCGDIGYQVHPGPDNSIGPPSVPQPATPPAPPEPSPPPPAPTLVPPLSTDVVDLTDGRAIGTSHWPDPRTDGSPIGRFTCVFRPPQALAFRAHLSILVNNELQKIPLYLGASRQPPTHCFYAVHTHDASGRIHVTPAAPETFTLGDLFEIWGQPLSNTNVAGFVGMPIEIFVTDAGTTVKVEDYDWASIELRPHREITIGIGTPLTEIPNFIWTDD
jgi:hypothetical protein